jgi:stage V sporulation protein R
MPHTFFNTNLPPDLRALKEEIEGHARAYGLDFYETIFEVVDADDLNEIAAYGGFPTRYPHWSFGMQYEELKKSYDYGLSKIYEMVINNDPCYAYLMRCNHTVDQKLVMAHVYGHCLAPETKVETRTGVKPISQVQKGEQVLTHTGVYRPVRVAAKRRHTGTVYRLTVAGSSEPVRITGEHPVYVLRPMPCVLKGREQVPCRPTCQVQHKCSAPRPYRAYQLQWVEAAEVRVGDFVVLPRRRSTPLRPPRFVQIPVDKVCHRRRVTGCHTVPVGESLGTFLGYFLAEGNAQARGLVGFGFHSDEAEFQAETAALAGALFDAKVGRDTYPASHATTVRFNALEVAAWLRAQVGTSAASKRIPDFLMDADDASLKACIRGAFHGDGYFTSTAGRRSGSLSLTTISEQLAYQIRHVCARWGIHTAVKSRLRPGRQRVYELIWTGASAHRLSEVIYGHDMIAGNRSFERSWSDENYIYQPVRSVEAEDYDGWVYNFSVEEDESYTLAAGMVVHNCDFFKNNAYFAHTSRKMMDEMANHGARVRRYVERFGEDEVEQFLDRCMSIDDLIDIHSTAIRRREEVSRYDFAKPAADDEEAVRLTRFKSKGYMDDYINPREALKAEEEERRKAQEAATQRFPERPAKDVLLFLIEHAPLKPWQRDVLAIVRDEAYYFMPQAQTKVMNEGWACVHINTFLYTDRGLLRAGEVVRDRLPVRVSDGQVVRAVYAWAKFEDRETAWVRTRRGLELEGSVTHGVLLPDGSWRRLDELQIGDRVTTGRGIQLWATEAARLNWRPPVRMTLAMLAERAGVTVDIARRRVVRGMADDDTSFAPLLAEYTTSAATVSPNQKRCKPIRVPEAVDERLAAFLGYLIGDGHISKVKRTIGLTTGDLTQAEHFAELTVDLFAVVPRRKWERTKWRVLFTSHNVQNFLLHLGLKTGFCAREKDVPDVILRSPKPVVAAFLRALYDCDGYAGKQGVILSTASTEMGKTVQLLLLNFGILSTRRPHKDGCWHLHTTGKSAEVFQREIGFGLERKRAKLREYVESHQWFKDEDDTDEIVAVERRRGDVYDISVEETHRYAAQGFINHNSYWHSTIMTEKALQPWECIDYADHHSGTMAMSGGRLNPYKIGIELLRDIQHRWDTGKFGKEWEECDDLDKKRKWDKKLGLGKQKIFEVRRVHNDITFIDTFLTPEFCVQHKLFTFAWQEQAGQYYIESRDFEQIKQRLLFSLTNFGKPWIYVIDGNYRNRGELLLKHEHAGTDLKTKDAQDTLANLQYIWGRPVHLETVVDGKPTLWSFDGNEHTSKPIGDADDARRNPPAKTR